MSVLKKIISDQTFIAHGLGLLGVVGTAIAGVNPLFGAIIAALTGIFHIAQTFGNGTAIPPGWSKTGATTDPLRAQRASAVSADGAPFGQPHVAGPAPPLPLMNAAGTDKVEP